MSTTGENSEKTPLHRAARNNAREVAVELIEHGANVHAKDKDGITPLLLAALCNAREVAGRAHRARRRCPRQGRCR